MPLTGIAIYKFLPKTNCKECGFPTCLAFAMKLAQKQADLAACKHVSEEARQALDEASRPPIRLVTIGSDTRKIQVGNETVLFRHEKTFFNPPGLVVRLKDSEGNLASQAKAIADYQVERVGRKLTLDGLFLENASGNREGFLKALEAVLPLKVPLILSSPDPSVLEAALEKAASGRPLIYAANKDNWQRMAELAKKYKCSLAVQADGGLSELASLVEQVNKAGVEDIVLDPRCKGFNDSLVALTQIRRLPLKKNLRLLGYPVMTFPGETTAKVEEEGLLAGQHISKYGGVIVLDHFQPALVYPLLTLRMNIYTDPQKPIQVQPGVYPIGSPKDTSPLLTTTNFSLTYFSIFGETEATGFPAWLMVVDTEGLSVLTSWAAGKFDAEKIAKAVKANNLEAQTISHKSLVIPGHVAVLRGELEEELPGWKIMVGPKDAVDIGAFLKRNWAN